MADLCPIEPGRGRVILVVVVVAHADDPALFLGGTIARWADAGWRVVCVRVTDDRWDSVGHTEAETVAACFCADLRSNIAPSTLEMMGQAQGRTATTTTRPHRASPG